MSKIAYETDGPVAIITLNRPEQRNAIDLPMRLDLVKYFNRVRGDSSIHAAVITGNGPTFSAGHDLKEVMTPEEEANDPSTPGLYSCFRSIGKPVVAAINGTCIAQGSGLALLADIRIGTKNTRFGWPQVKFGMPSNSGPTLLTRMLPWNIAMEYLMTGDFIDAETAYKHDLLNRIVEPEDLMAEALAFAHRMAAVPPLGIQAIKQSAIATANLDLGVAFDVAIQLVGSALRHPDVEKGLEKFAATGSATDPVES